MTSGRRRREPRRLRAAAVATCLASLLGACGSSPSPSQVATAGVGGATPGATPTDIDPALLEPLTALGPCTAEPNVLDEPPAEGALLPPDAVLTSQAKDGPLTTLKGYVPMTPVQIRVFYQRQETHEVLQVEDEIRESEVLLADGNNRLFVKSQAICELGSVFLAVLAPESSGAVPTPAGGAG